MKIEKKYKDIRFLIASHAAFDKEENPMHGTGSEISPILCKLGSKHIFIKHSLVPGHKTLIEFNDCKKVKKEMLGFKYLPFLLMRLQELVITLNIMVRTKNRPDIFIGIDPYNGAIAILAKWLGLTKHSVFYTADYAHKRFNNRFMNKIYHMFDNFCVKHSDQVWNVSSRICKLRKKNGISDAKNFMMPNTPNYIQRQLKPLSKINKHDLVIVSSLISSIDYKSIFLSIDRLAKKYKDVRLLVIGDGSEKESLVDLVKKQNLDKHIFFLGNKEHSDVLKILSKSGIGLAIYTKNNNWTEFGDSMKIREYLACGLPVLTNNIVSTADDIQEENVGFVFKKEDKKYDIYIDSIFSNEKLFMGMRKNALQFARRNVFSNKFVEAISALNK